MPAFSDALDWRATVALLVPIAGGAWSMVKYSFATREEVRTNARDNAENKSRIEKLETNTDIMQKQLVATEALAESMKEFKSEVKDNFGELRGAMLDMTKSQSNIEGYLNRGGKIRKDGE